MEAPPCPCLPPLKNLSLIEGKPLLLIFHLTDIFIVHTHEVIIILNYVKWEENQLPPLKQTL